MKDNSKPSAKTALVDAKQISIAMVSSSSTSSASSNLNIIRIVPGNGVPSPSASTVSIPSAVVIGAAKLISRSQGVATNTRLVSRGTQTGAVSVPEDLQEKRRLIRKQLAVLLHAVLCRVRDELIGNTGETARQCPTAFCGLMKNVLNHMRTCTLPNCTQPHCLSSRQILDHWKSCTQADCQVCSSLRRVVPAYLNAVVTNPRWRNEIMTRFNWLISFIGPISMRTTPPFQIPPLPQAPAVERSQMEMDEEEAGSIFNSAEE